MKYVRRLEVDVIICLAFGKRETEVSLSNKFLIEKIVDLNQQTPLPLIIQKDCSDYFPNNIKITKVISDHAETEKYLDTREVLRQSINYCKENSLKKALIFAHPDHVPRIENDLKYFNFDYGIAYTKGCPYDSKSTQVWTRNRFFFMFRELIVRTYYRITY